MAQSITEPQHCVGLLDLPDVAAYTIVGYCGRQSLLELRQVCRTTQLWVDTHPSPFIKITYLESKDTLVSFVRQVRTLPLRTFRLGFLDPYYYTWPEFYAFSYQFAHNIRHLRLQVFCCCELQHEFQFLEQLTNLTHLTVAILQRLPFIDKMGTTLREKFHSFSESDDTTASVPFKGLVNVTHLIFERVEGTSYFMDFIKGCPNLRYVVLPSELMVPFDTLLPSWFYDLVERKIMEYVIEVATQDLREINFSDNSPLCFTESNASLHEKFIVALSQKNVKLSYLPVYSLERAMQVHTGRLLDMFKSQVKSYIGIWPNRDIPTLKNLEDYIYDTYLEPIFPGHQFRPASNEWPNLKTITATVYDPRNDEEREYYNQLQKLLFKSQPRPTVEKMDLEIRTTTVVPSPNQLAANNQLFIVPSDISFANFPNLKILKLFQTHIFTQNPGLYSSLFRALGIHTAIHTLHISSLSAITPEGFSGPPNPSPPGPPELPAFQQMRTLRVFTLEVFYDRMILSQPDTPKRQKLSTRVLRYFRDMSLERLEFTGVDYSNVNAIGLRYLLSGPISQSVRDFTFEVSGPKGEKRELSKNFKMMMDNIESKCWQNRQRLLYNTAKNREPRVN